MLTPPSSLFSLPKHHGGNTEDIVHILKLPPKHETLELVESFFAKHGPVNPFLDKLHFLTTNIDEIYNDHKVVKLSSLALLNAVLAIATSLSTNVGRSTEEKTLDARNFFQRAKALYTKSLFRTISLETGRSLLIS